MSSKYQIAETIYGRSSCLNETALIAPGTTTVLNVSQMRSPYNKSIGSTRSVPHFRNLKAYEKSFGRTCRLNCKLLHTCAYFLRWHVDSLVILVMKAHGSRSIGLTFSFIFATFQLKALWALGSSYCDSACCGRKDGGGTLLSNLPHYACDNQSNLSFWRSVCFSLITAVAILAWVCQICIIFTDICTRKSRHRTMLHRISGLILRSCAIPWQISPIFPSPKFWA